VRTDAEFVDRVRAALAIQIEEIVDEAGGDVWRRLQHRQLAGRMLALVAAWRDPRGPGGAGDLLGLAVRLGGHLRGLRGPSGLFTGGDNVDSPPDSAFSVNDLADALLLLRDAETTRPESPHDTATTPPSQADEKPGSRHNAETTPPGRLAALVEDLLDAATPALLAGGVHTPNHRWELSAALSRLHRLRPRPELAARIDQWLAEGVDIDEDGLYSERSANYAAFVSNPSLLTIADVVKRPELVDAVERNLDATLDLLRPDGTVETVLSRRQDQKETFLLAPYLLPLRRVALSRGRGDLAWAAGLALAQGVVSPAGAMAAIVLEPGIASPLPAPREPVRPRQRVFGAAGLLMDHRRDTTTVVFGGSDLPRQGRVRSGLANSPTFLRVFRGGAVLEDVRLTRTFFGLGPFRGDGLAVTQGDDGTEVRLAEAVAAGYHQPLTPGDRDGAGRYQLGDEGRFSAAMGFDRRGRDEVGLATTVRVRLTDTRAELIVDVSGAVVDWALELAFRPGGSMTGARPLGGRRWQLAAQIPAGTASYQVGDDSLRVTVVDASDGRGGAARGAVAEPCYEPGEEYRFLGGTDAVGGERLYLTAQAPTRLHLYIDSIPRG
jgi:hypothetical protein